MTLHEAAQAGDVATIRRLLAAGTPPDARDERGYTALHAAAHGDQPEAARALLEAGLDRDARTPKGSTPLIVAAVANAARAIAVLLAAGADVNAANKSGLTALQYSSGGRAREVHKLLKEAAANVPKAPRASRDEKAFWKAAEAGDAAKLRELLAAGVSPNVSLMRGETALTRAAAFDHLDATLALLEAGADPHVRDGQGNTLLHNAVWAGGIELVRALLAKGLAVNAVNDDRITPLMAAAQGGHLEIARLLLEAGADPSARGDFVFEKNKTALEFALKHNEDRRVKTVFKELLAGAGAPPDPTEFAFQAAEGFAEAAQRPDFQAMIELLAEVCVKPPKPSKKCAGAYQCAQPNVVRLTARYANDAGFRAALAEVGSAEERAGLLLARLQKEVRAAGSQLVKADVLDEATNAKLLLFPTAEKYAVLAALKTDGANYGHDTRRIIAWLREMERENPFVLTGCGPAFVAGAFERLVVNPMPLAERMCKFCLDLLDGDVIETPAQVAAELEQSGEFVFWWG